jgi:release factor glutamine methyltransferase
MQVSKFIQEISQKISPYSLNPRLDARLILTELLGVPIEHGYLDEEILINKVNSSKLAKILDRISNGEPLVYILAKTEFCGIPMIIRPGVLIPRPETEGLVQIVTEHLINASNSLRILEVGAGSGAITCAIANYVNHNITIPIDYLAIDISHVAIEIALENLTNTLGIAPDMSGNRLIYKVKNLTVSICQRDVLTTPYTDLGRIDIIVSNPPYLTQRELGKLPISVSNFEPSIALYGGKDGMKFYRSILDIAKAQDLLPILFLEIGPAIAAPVQKLFEAVYNHVEIKTDLFGRTRYLIAQ